jgi:prepilin-type N-terminal cleavage/methylation domain-containing protein
MSAHDKGFTLVEVMIGAVILFSALAVGTLAYRTSIQSLAGIKANVVVADALPAIMAEVRTQIFSRAKDGNGVFGKGITYSWNAEPVRASRDVLAPRDEFTGGLEYGAYNLVLNRVRLTITFGADERKIQSEYTYQEFSWSR